ncbi:MAG: Na+/H+ antiporter NhaA, partial [Actinobacteria bacterium]|nr:Na+/H+ antiporter NhaA [Actinomycetota bacterium]
MAEGVPDRELPAKRHGSLHLDLSLAQWAADGLLAIFFFVVGLELKRELVAGNLRDPRRAILPIAAAVGGMLVPALLFVMLNLNAGGDALRGWAIPTATDVAFVLAVLALVSTHLPAAMRAFMLTLAVVDDLLAIMIIAVFYTESLDISSLLLAGAPLTAFTILVQRGIRTPWLLLPLAALTWVLMHMSGVHATVAGVLCGFAVPVMLRRPAYGPGMARYLEHRWQPLSAGLAVPVFAFFSAGVSIADSGALVRTLSDSVTLGVLIGLVMGKAVGVLGVTLLMQRLTRTRLDKDVAWPDLLGLALLAGIGFTVSLLVGDLAFGVGSERYDHVTVGVLVGSVVSGLLAMVVLCIRNRDHRCRQVEGLPRPGEFDGQVGGGMPPAATVR